MSNTSHGFETVVYWAEGVQDVARILKHHQMTDGARQITAIRTFHREGFVMVAIPAGRLVINRKVA